MPLTDIGDRASTPEGMTARSQDASGNKVVVYASHEAIQDYGWNKIFSVASAKYDRGRIVPNSNPPRVQITTSDFPPAVGAHEK